MTIEVEVVDALAVSVTAVPIGRKYDGLTRTVSLDRTITPSATYIRTALPYKRYRGTLFATPSYNQSIIL